MGRWRRGCSGVRAINNVSGLGTAFLGGGALRQLVSALYRTGAGRSATVFFQNADDQALFLSERLVRPEQARLLPGSGIDLDRFAVAPMANAPGFTFLLVARLLWDKGVGEFVEAARIVGARHPTARFQLLGQLGAANRTAGPRDTVDAWVGEGVVDYLGATGDVRPFIAAADCVGPAILPRRPAAQPDRGGGARSAHDRDRRPGLPPGGGRRGHRLPLRPAFRRLARRGDGANDRAAGGGAR